MVSYRRLRLTAVSTSASTHSEHQRDFMPVPCRRSEFWSSFRDLLRRAKIRHRRRERCHSRSAHLPKFGASCEFAGAGWWRTL